MIEIPDSAYKRMKDGELVDRLHHALRIALVKRERADNFEPKDYTRPNAYEIGDILEHPDYDNLGVVIYKNGENMIAYFHRKRPEELKRKIFRSDFVSLPMGKN